LDAKRVFDRPICERDEIGPRAVQDDS